MLNGLDLFSGIGGLTVALGPWVRPFAYCEVDRFPQSVILSRISEGLLPWAPIWDDIRTLEGRDWRGVIDIVYGGFPCQDISVAGNGAGLEGERSGLFFEILRLVDEIQPPFVFLENVPAIRTRGSERVVKELSSRGYDCRWTVLSANEVGAPHLRKRWFLLAYRDSNGCEVLKKLDGQESQSTGSLGNDTDGLHNVISDSERFELREQSGRERGPKREGPTFPGNFGENGMVSEWWSIEPDVGRVANGIPNRVDRIKGLGNAVVPAQARQAFKELMGLKK